MKNSVVHHVDKQKRGGENEKVGGQSQKLGQIIGKMLLALRRASTINWATLYPYICLSESDSKLCTYFEICVEKNHNLIFLENALIHKAKKSMLTKIISRRGYV